MSKKLGACYHCGSRSLEVFTEAGWSNRAKEFYDGFLVGCDATKNGCGASGGRADTKKGARKMWLYGRED